MKKLWIRIGAEIELPNDFNVSEDSIGELEDIIDEKVSNGQFKVCGETYAPCFEGDEYVNHLITGSEPEVNFIYEEGKQMKVYLVVNDWATEDSSDVSITVFDTPEKAKGELLKQRAEEINECWEQAFDNGEIRQGYCLDENDFLFEIWEDGYYVTSHTRIQIIEKEVN